MSKVVKELIHANGIDIEIYTEDFQNEYISITDIARYKSDNPTAVIQNWMRNRDVIEFLGLWEILHNSNFKPIEFEGFKNQAGANAFTMSPKKWIDSTDAIGIVSEADMLNVVLFGKTAKQWRDANPYEAGNIRELATIYQLLVLANMESYNAILIQQGKSQEERMKLLHELAVQQMTTISSLELDRLPGIADLSTAEKSINLTGIEQMARLKAKAKKVR